MKRILLLILTILIIIVIVIAASPTLIEDPGYILISSGDLIMESTIVAMASRLILVFIALTFVLKLLRGSLNFSFATWNKIAFAGRRRALRNLNKGIAAYVLGDYQQSEHLLAKSAEASSLEHIAYLVAADAAQKQALKPNTEHYLALLEKSTDTLKEAGLEAILIKIKLLIGQQNYQLAREVIDQHHKHIGHDARLLSLEIDLSLIEQRFEYVVKQLNSAKKQKTITSETIANWQQAAFYGAFNNQIKQHDNNALLQYWQQLAKKVKQEEVVVLAYCRVLAENNVNKPLAKVLLPVVKKGADSKLLKLIRSLPITQANELVAAAQKHLHNDPQNALWLSLVAHFAVFSQQWPLAEKAFNTLVNLEGSQYDKIDLLVFASVLEQQSEYEKANQVLRKIHT